MSQRPARTLRGCALTLLSACFILCGVARAQQPILDDVRTIAATGAPVPHEHDFDISVAGTYKITLTDLGSLLTPSAPVTSVTLAVTTADAIVGTPLVGAGTLQITATQGSYRLHIVGKPGPVPGSGPVGVTVTDASGNVIYSFSDTIATPAQAVPNSTALLDDTFQVQTTGNYQVSLNDLAFPQLLDTLTLSVVQEGSPTPVAILPDPNTQATQAVVNLTTGVNYRIFAIGVTGSAVGGLYSAVVTPQAGGTPVYSHATPIGSVISVGTTTLSAGTYSFTATDLAFPAALTQAGAILLLNGQMVATTPAASFTATDSSGYQVFASATTATAGSYSVQISPPTGAPAFSLAEAVTAPGATSTGYTFSATIPSAAAYTVNLVDLQTPRPLLSGSIAAVQNGALLATPLTTTGNFSVNAAAGPLTVLVFAQGAASGGSLFDVNIAAAGGALVFDQPGAAGVPFTSQKLAVTTAGAYTATANDLTFPAKFQDLALIVTQGGTVVGSIFAGGTLPPFQATAGTYYVSLLATPDSTAGAGTYALNVATAPPIPTVTLTASPTDVAAGGTVALSWTSTNSTSCTASGGSWSGHWTGADAAKGSATSPTISTATTFTLTCQGLGGTGSASANVTVDAAPTKSGGGGGALELESILALLAILFVRRNSNV